MEEYAKNAPLRPRTVYIGPAGVSSLTPGAAVKRPVMARQGAGQSA
jgi:hypothetical protein